MLGPEFLHEELHWIFETFGLLAQLNPKNHVQCPVFSSLLMGLGFDEGVFILSTMICKKEGILRISLVDIHFLKIYTEDVYGHRQSWTFQFFLKVLSTKFVGANCWNDLNFRTLLEIYN